MRASRFLFTLAQILCLAMFLCFLTAGPARAAASPSDVLRDTVDKVLSILQQPDYADPAKRQPLRDKIEQIVRDVFDFTEFSKRTIATYWSGFNPDQQRRFTAAFSDLLITTYVDKVNGYNGEKVVYLGERFSQANRLAEVQTTITLSSGQVTPIAYRMIMKDNAWHIYDVLVENVGLNSNYRAQFNEILTNSPPDELIRRVEERVKELRRQNAGS
jgi:phospholipid transport system substrate-binding protein